MSSALKLAFAGTPDFAAAHLKALLSSQHELVAVYTQPDRRAGRGKKLVPSPVKTLAESEAVPVLQPASLKDADAQKEMAALGVDALVVVAYGLILPQSVLDIPRFGCLNVHGSLLPDWRGAAPIQRAIEAGDTESGVTIMQMDAGLDTGPMLAKAHCTIENGYSAGDLHDRLLELGPPLLVDVLDDLATYLDRAQAQEGKASYAHKIERNDAQLDWQLPAQLLQQKVLAFNPVPGAWTTLEGDSLKIWQATAAEGDGKPGEIIRADSEGLVVASGKGALQITTLQIPGGRAIAVADLLNARREAFGIGVILGG